MVDLLFPEFHDAVAFALMRASEGKKSYTRERYGRQETSNCI